MRPKEENAIDKTQSEAGFLESGMKETLLMEIYEQIRICIWQFSLPGGNDRSQRRNDCG